MNSYTQQPPPLGVQPVGQKRRSHLTCRQIRERFERAEAAAQIGSYEFDLVTGERHWSQEMYRLLRRHPSLGPIPTEEFIALIHPDDRERLVKAINRTILEGQPFNEEYQLTFPDGESRYLVSMANVTKDASGRPILISGFAKDITERKVAEMALMSSEARLRESQERFERSEAASQMGSLEIDLATGATHWSPELYRLWKQAPALGPLRTEQWLKIIHPADRKRVLAASVATRQTGVPFDEVYQVQFSRGERRHYHTVLKAKCGEKGRPIFISGTTRDVTEREEREAAIIRATEEERQRVSMEIHDSLGQKLTGMSLLVEQLVGDLNAKRPVGRDTPELLLRLTKDFAVALRDIAKGIQPVPAYSAGLMTSLERLVAETVVPRDVECLFRCPDPVLVEDQSVANKLFRIAQEALNNALRHGHPRLVIIRLLRSGGEICLEILDDGKGIPKELRGNRGLGMRTMRFRAQAVRGSLTVKRLSPKGTLVRVALPDVTQQEADQNTSDPSVGEDLAPVGAA